MKAWELQSFGLEDLKQVERDERAPGPGEVKVRVRACSLNYRDWLTIAGLYNPKQKLPLVPLSDGAGEVVQVGEGVRSLERGDRVCNLFCPDWQAGEPSRARIRGTLGGPNDGMLQEYVTLPERAWRRFPAHMSFHEAATLPCAAHTAWSALVELGGIKAGDTVLILGTGGVSIFALQIAKLMGAVPIVTSSSDEKLERARGMGAAHTINYKTTERWDKEVLELTAGRGVDHVVEVGGAGTLDRSVRAARFGGNVALIGVLAGPSDVNLVPVLMKQVRVQGVIVGHGDGFDAMNAAFDAAHLHPVVDEVFGFGDVPRAFEHLVAGKHFGKVVIEG
jgi:NADPH:quinone reductase-like Zn-dependent oxidoreductase